MDSDPIKGRSIPSLDGLRAFSVALVLASHGAFHAGIGWLPAYPVLQLGFLGVRIFFVISGFLITTLLLNELAAGGRISLKMFYLRRSLRIGPPYYVYLAAVILLSARGIWGVTGGGMLSAAIYASDYFHVRSWDTAHTWTLAVEEQFYLLWPAALALGGRRNGLRIALLMCFCCPLIRVLYFVVFGVFLRHPAQASGFTVHFETVADALAAGCLLAGFRARLHAWPTYRGMLASPLFLVVPAALGVIQYFSASHGFQYLAYISLGVTALNLGIALCIDWCIVNAGGVIGRILNARPIAFVGLISYSIYLWQELFLGPGVPFGRLAVLALIAAASLISYFAVERPSRRLRSLLEAKMSSRWRGNPAGFPLGSRR